MRVVVLAGGTGSSKLLRGLAKICGKVTVVTNVGDNFWTHGLYVCPDLDTAVYTLAGISNPKTGWGVGGDTFRTLGGLGKLGEESWFRLGDIDMATHIVRTKMLNEGKSLTQITSFLSKKLGAGQAILPATDSHVETRMVTSKGEMHLQEFWVRHKGLVPVRSVRYVGATRAAPTPEVREAVSNAEKLVVCPANPVTSIGPILAISGMKELFASSSAECVAVSPMRGNHPFSGPARKLMRAVNARPDSMGVARLYAGVVDSLLIHQADASMKTAIEKTGLRCKVADTTMKSEQDEVRLAEEVLSA
jgi:LPPG:FO 2-phospho-L-lactate transferase